MLLAILKNTGQFFYRMSLIWGFLHFLIIIGLCAFFMHILRLCAFGRDITEFMLYSQVYHIRKHIMFISFHLLVVLTLITWLRGYFLDFSLVIIFSCQDHYYQNSVSVVLPLPAFLVLQPSTQIVLGVCWTFGTFCLLMKLLSLAAKAHCGNVFCDLFIY